MDDNNIVELFLKRDQKAITETKDKYGSRLRSLAKHITTDDFTADECENDTYMQAWNSIPPNEPRTYLYAYLARIVRHIALNRCEMNNA
ncbi:MAG: RNA polymerase subunit sigma-70, partial [Oscillospiraceae bacterium]|nr:RNA polymerase subunit sigma-70 [Oscillospiraceae bacterium]